MTGIRETETLMEVTWVFADLMHEGRIKPWQCLTEEYCGTLGVDHKIMDIANEFEEENKDADWLERDFLHEVRNFAKEKILEEFGRGSGEGNDPDMTDMFCAHCNWGFGMDHEKANYCPRCGHPMTHKK